MPADPVVDGQNAAPPTRMEPTRGTDTNGLMLMNSTSFAHSRTGAGTQFPSIRNGPGYPACNTRARLAPASMTWWDYILRALTPHPT